MRVGECERKQTVQRQDGGEGLRRPAPERIHKQTGDVSAKQLRPTLLRACDSAASL